MNPILQLKGSFYKAVHKSRPPFYTLPSNTEVTSSHVEQLHAQLRKIQSFWEQEALIGGALISVHYIRIVPKSARLKILLSANTGSPDSCIRGARFEQIMDEKGEKQNCHVFTYFISLEAIAKTLSLLETGKSILTEHYNGRFTSADSQKENMDEDYHYDDELKRYLFSKLMVDCYFVHRFDIDIVYDMQVNDNTIVTLYQTGKDARDILGKLGIQVLQSDVLDENTIRMAPDEIQLLREKAPYLISMENTDFMRMAMEVDQNTTDDTGRLISPPSNEPVIGVFDTQFNENVYFHEWVKYTNALSPDIPLDKEDFIHGTAVDSILVDGPKGNPALEDGCGHFRVRHYGVATHDGVSISTMIRCIRTAVAENRDIKVWNISLGSKTEIDPNCISIVAAELDRIQHDSDVLFVVAGTNIPAGVEKKSMKVGAPADSLNSVVVNAVDREGGPASYSRRGPVLSFFNKPDVSCFGGDGVLQADKMVVCCGETGAAYKDGTSYAAPWIARKLAYLIYIIGMSREAAKALLIDSAAQWGAVNAKMRPLMGYGRVPVHINDLLKTRSDEIRFFITGTAEDATIYNYQLPIPEAKGAFPFAARATLVYFPPVDRRQGVDYTSTEMDLRFGRVKVSEKETDDGKQTIAKIVPINGDTQGDDEPHTLYEEDARKQYRKWDNIKHISEKLTSRTKPKKEFGSSMWGLEIHTLNRPAVLAKAPMRFGIVITLRELKGVNRIDDFIKLCMARNWMVYTIDVENQLELYQQEEEEIQFDS